MTSATLPKAVDALVGTGRPSCQRCSGAGVLLSTMGKFRPCLCTQALREVAAAPPFHTEINQKGQGHLKGR